MLLELKYNSYPSRCFYVISPIYHISLSIPHSLNFVVLLTFGSPRLEEDLLLLEKLMTDVTLYSNGVLFMHATCARNRTDNRTWSMWLLCLFWVWHQRCFFFPQKNLEAKYELLKTEANVDSDNEPMATPKDKPVEMTMTMVSYQ